CRFRAELCGNVKAGYLAPGEERLQTGARSSEPELSATCAAS
ncbi:hypothetical protein chiPu_0023618, partial [Chiloscyllium punctatum]|nr:hypothetical protein [Chiloscyllium punctatum]